MHRRHLLQGAALLLAAPLSACSTLGAVAGLLGNQLVFSAPQLQGYLDKRFPRDYDKLGGLVTLSVLHPRLSIPQGSDRLRLDFDVGFGMLGRGTTPSGHIAIASGLRFDPQTRGLHLDAPTLEQADVPSLGGALGGSGRDLVDRWLADYARDEPVYRFDQGLWQRLGARRIGATTIEHGQVVVHLQ
ncbi:MAG TPA: hypothetical protein VLM17_09905 [Xanthomonadaceae bacterium]|nr:hypothetical protein [Xanthomonadaceae bacterium]